MKLMFILMVFSLMLMGFANPFTRENCSLSRGEQLGNNILAETTKIIKNKYKLSPIGAGSSMPDGPIRHLTLSFNIRGPLTRENLREVLINGANEFLEQVTHNEEIQQYLKYKPFTLKNVEIIIYNQDRNGRSLRDPEISVARISDGDLVYKTIDPEDKFNYKNEFEETYEEALEILKNQK